MLTKQQKINISKLPQLDLLEILDICSEQLGLISPDEYLKATNVKRSTFYAKINSGEIKSYQISNNKFPLMNLR